MERVRVVVHADDSVTKWGIASYLRARPEIYVLSESAIADADVVVFAVTARDANLTAQLRSVAELSEARIVLVTDHLPSSDLFSAVEHHVVAVLSRTALSCERLAAAVLSANAGRGELPPDLLGTLLQHVERVQREVLKPRGLTMSGLAEREVDMLRLLAEGFDTGEIARKLSYSERTVKSMVQNVLTRFQLRNRTHAVAYAIRSGAI